MLVWSKGKSGFYQSYDTLHTLKFQFGVTASGISIFMHGATSLKDAIYSMIQTFSRLLMSIEY